MKNNCSSVILNLDPEYFSQCTVTNNTDSNRSVIHESLNGRENLLVTIGDSWTWGDSLDNIDITKGISDSPRRVDLIYGKHLSNLLESDWINIAYPGIDNGWIANTAWRFQFIKHLLPYKTIYISVGFTDIARDVITYGSDSSLSFLENAKQYEKNYFKILSSIENETDIKIVVGRNFTDTFDDNANIVKHHLRKRWIDVSRDSWKKDYCIPKSYFMRYPDSLSESDRFFLLENCFSSTSAVLDFLDQCPLHYKQASKHPNETSHLLWANYVYDQMKQYNIL